MFARNLTQINIIVDNTGFATDQSVPIQKVPINLNVQISILYTPTKKYYIMIWVFSSLICAMLITIIASFGIYNKNKKKLKEFIALH